MSSPVLVSMFRTGTSPNDPPTAAVIAINNNGQVVLPSVAGRRAVAFLGAITAAADATVVIYSGPDATGDVVAEIPMTGGQPVPISIFAVYSAVGEGLFIDTNDAVAITGRLICQYV